MSMEPIPTHRAPLDGEKATVESWHRTITTLLADMGEAKANGLISRQLALAITSLEDAQSRIERHLVRLDEGT